MHVFDTPRDTNVPAGLKPKMLINVFIIKGVMAGLKLATVPWDEWTVSTVEAVRNKLADLMDVLADIRDNAPDDEVTERLEYFIGEMESKKAEIIEARGRQWNPEYTNLFELPAEEAVDAFLIVSINDMRAITDRIYLDRLEESL